jgi:hypothetical protein
MASQKQIDQHDDYLIIPDVDPEKYWWFEGKVIKVLIEYKVNMACLANAEDDRLMFYISSLSTTYAKQRTFNEIDIRRLLKLLDAFTKEPECYTQFFGDLQNPTMDEKIMAGTYFISQIAPYIQAYYDIENAYVDYCFFNMELNQAYCELYFESKAKDFIQIET